MNKKSYPFRLGNDLHYLEIIKGSRRKTMTLKIDLKNKNPIVKIPYYTPYKTGFEFFQKNWEWYKKQIANLSGLDFASCDTIKLNDEPYTIHRHLGRNNKGIIYSNNKTIYLTYKENQADIALINLLKQQALENFTYLSQEKAQLINKKINKITVMDSKKWGSCSSLGNLRYNFRLVMAPVYVQDYLAAHEVAHLKEFNHSKNFWDLVDYLTPYSIAGKEWLKNYGKSLY